MAKKNVKTELKPPPTKRQLSRRQRQQRIQRIIVIAGIVFFVFILGIIGYGYYAEQYKPLHEPVAKINDTTYDMDYYIKLLELYTQGKDAAETSATADTIIDIIEYGEVIRKASPELGFGVSIDEVNSALKNAGLPDEKVYRDTIGSTLLANRIMQNTISPLVPPECEQARAQALFVESEEKAKEVADRLREGGAFPTLAQQYSLEALTKMSSGNLGWLPKGFTDIFLGDLRNSLLKDLAFSLEPGVLSEPTYDGSIIKDLGYWIVEVTEKDENRGSHARGILLGSQKEAEAIRARIEAGEDFAALAKAYSQDSWSKDQGGDLGWIKPGDIDNSVITRIALQLEPGVLSQPTVDSSAQTKGGYWLVNVVERDNSRAVDDETRATIEEWLFDGWVSEHLQETSVEKYLTEKQKAWAVNRVLKDRGQ